VKHVRQNFKAGQPLAESTLKGAEDTFENGEAFHGSGESESVGRSAQYAMTTFPTQRRNINGRVAAADSQHVELNVDRQPTYSAPPPQQYSSSVVEIRTTRCTSATAANRAASEMAGKALNCAQSLTPTATSFPSSSASSGLPHTDHSMSVTPQSSDILRRSNLAEVRPWTATAAASRPLHGPGSAVARLFGGGTSSTLPAAVRGPAASRGRRSLHHSWVRSGRTGFKDAEAVDKTSASVPAPDNSDTTNTSNHSERVD